MWRCRWYHICHIHISTRHRADAAVNTVCFLLRTTACEWREVARNVADIEDNVSNGRRLAGTVSRNNTDRRRCRALCGPQLHGLRVGAPIHDAHGREEPRRVRQAGRWSDSWRDCAVHHISFVSNYPCSTQCASAQTGTNTLTQRRPPPSLPDKLNVRHGISIYLNRARCAYNSCAGRRSRPIQRHSTKPAKGGAVDGQFVVEL